VHRLSVALVAVVSSVVFTQNAAAQKTAINAPVAVVSWTGFYGGINGGYGWDRTSGSVDSAADPATVIFLGGGSWFTPDQFASAFRQSGGIIGAQAGYNWQFSDRWVGGVEIDIQYAHVHGSSSNVLFLNPAFFGTDFPFTSNTERTLEWFGTLRGRLGYLATPSLLIYGTGGMAFGKTTSNGSVAITAATNSSIGIGAGGSSLSCSNATTAMPCYIGSGSRTSVGWAAGAGFEYKFSSNMTAKVECLHVDLGGQTINLVSPPPSTPGVAIQYGLNREGVDIVRVGLNYGFHP
jgi:outer membrane immunogenic protein